MAHEMAQKVPYGLWPSVIRFWPHWHKSEITYANTVNALLNVGTKSQVRLPLL